MISTGASNDALEVIGDVQAIAVRQAQIDGHDNGRQRHGGFTRIAAGGNSVQGGRDRRPTDRLQVGADK
ncbi:hypothetical protein ACFVTE_18940 [Arthrobacter sp. NPDC058097]|uniref:hypothetical protein n=1 Tax=Arthrobacter sp. NPDC058097 TaxID=3346340 RepID=UPI0036DDFC67